LRFEGDEADVYVIEGACGKSFSVVQTGGLEMCDVARFPRAEDAIRAALTRLAG
jgi:hypothetical protein